MKFLNVATFVLSRILCTSFCPSLGLVILVRLAYIGLVQERLVKCHGIQCGFCSPGMVMSLYALLRNDPHPSQQQVERAIEGKFSVNFELVNWITTQTCDVYKLLILYFA